MNIDLSGTITDQQTGDSEQVTVKFSAPVNWFDLGSAGLSGENGIARAYLTPDGNLRLNIHKGFDALTSDQTITFANAIPSTWIPSGDLTTAGDPVALRGSGTPNMDTRIYVGQSNGLVKIASVPAGATGVGCDLEVPIS